MTDVAAQRDLRVKVKTESHNSISKVTELSYRTASVRTPARALFLAARDPLSESRAIQTPQYRGINEVYRRISSAKVDEIDSDLDAQRDFQSRVLLADSPDQLSSELLITVLSLEERGPDKKWRTWKPTSKQIDYLVDFLCGIPVNNVVVPPVIPDASGSVYLGFVRQFFQRLPSHRSVAVAGLVPNVSHRDVGELLSFYRSLGLTSYVVDFRGKPPTTNWPLLPAFGSHLGFISREHGPHFAHALNARHGLRRDRSGWVPARDMLLLTECFDSFGAPHTIPPMSREFMKKLEEGSIEPAPPKLFDPQVYGYRAEELSMGALRARARKLGLEASLPGTAYSQEANRSAICKVLNAAANAAECQSLAQQVGKQNEVAYLSGKKAVIAEMGRVREIADAYMGRHNSRLDDFI